MDCCTVIRGLLLALFVLLSIHCVSCHPQCLDFGPPFDAQANLTFCPQYSSFGCCTVEDDRNKRIQYENLRVIIPAGLWAKCASYVKSFICQICSPYAAHIFEAEIPPGVSEVQPRYFPGLCRGYCTGFYENCKEIVDYYLPKTNDAAIERQKLANASISGIDAFCNSVQLSDNDYCFPELLTNNMLNGNVSISQVTKEGCLCVEKFASGLRNPILARHANDGSQRLFIAEQVGLVYVYYPNGSREPEPFLNVSKDVFTSSFEGDERGFLGLAFHPNFKYNHKFYVYYSREISDMNSNDNHIIRISEYQVQTDNGNKANMTSERIILEFVEPFWNHNGGEIMFGPDNYLYLFVGDGGQGGDPLRSGQDLTSLLGKVLRIDIDTYSSGKPYGIPNDNPFIDSFPWRSEIYAYGVRNIWRCGMDRGDPETGYGKGRIICGDVGQNKYEELDLLVKGANYGWNGFEGNYCYDEYVCEYLRHYYNGTDLVFPIHAYDHSIGKSVTGGHFYRGCQSPNLNGFYIYGDFMFGRLFRLLENQETGEWENKEIQMCGPDKCTAPLQGTYQKSIISFGEDEDGEIYMLSTATASPADPAGEVYKIVDPSRRGNPAKCRSARTGSTPAPPTRTTPTTPPTRATPTTTPHPNKPASKAKGN